MTGDLCLGVTLAAVCLSLNFASLLGCCAYTCAGIMGLAGTLAVFGESNVRVFTGYLDVIGSGYLGFSTAKAILAGWGSGFLGFSRKAN